jgi:hypothetical protein
MGYIGQTPSAVPLTSADIVDGTITNDDLAGSITDAKISALSASKLTGSLPASMATDTTPIENDLAVLALQNAVNSNITAHGLQNSWIEQFEDSNSITGLTNCQRSGAEFVSSVYSDYSVDSDTLLFIESNTSNGSATFTDSSTYGRTVTVVGNTQHSTTQQKIGATSIYFDGTGDALSVPDSNDWAFAGDHTIDFWVYPTRTGTNEYIVAFGPDGPWSNIPWNLSWNTSLTLNFQHSNNGGSGFSWLTGTISVNAWNHVAISRTGNDWKQFINGTLNHSVTNSSVTQNYAGDPHFGMNSSGTAPFLGYMDNIRVTNKSLYTASFTAPSQTSNATGSFTSTTITPQDAASKSSAGLVLLYKNNAGTNTLNTDVICKVSADNGSNYSTCVLASKGTFSTGINIAIAPAIAVTAGTQLKYKVEFANQASGSKEAQIHGVALQY